MQKIKLSSKLSNVQCKAIKEADGKTDATLRYVCMSALVTPTQGSGEEKFMRVALANRLRDAGDEIELTGEEVQVLRQVVGQVFQQPEVVYAAWQLLVPEAAAPKKLQVKKGGKK